MTDWVRLWHDMPTDPKWRVVARKSGQPLACVIAVFNLMMVNASGNGADRGTLTAWDDEDAAAALDMEAEDVAAIRTAMQGKVLEGNRLAGWEKRQPKREDGTAAKRKEEWKERQRNAAERSGTQEDAPETETETETEVISEPNGSSAHIAPEEILDSKKAAIGACLEAAYPAPEDSDEGLTLKPEHLTEAWNAGPAKRGAVFAKRMGSSRRRKAIQFLRKYPVDDITEAIGAVEKSRFLCGQTREEFRADIEFLFSEQHMNRLLEGFYAR